MITKKPINTISYNSDYFLLSILDTLISKGKIKSFSYIRHLPEPYEQKEHFHVRIVPLRPINLEKLTKIFCESFDKFCLSFRVASCYNVWRSYVLHDVFYLDMRGQTRKHFYRISDIKHGYRD